MTLSRGAVDERSALGRRALVLDVTLVVFTTVVTVLGLVGSTRLVDRTAAGGLGWLLAPVLAGLLLARRRFPLGVLLVSIAVLLLYYVSGRPAVGLELPLAAAFLSTAERGRAVAAAVTAAVLVAFTGAVRIWQGQDPVRLIALEMPVTVVVMAGAIGAGDAIRSRRLRRAAEEERQRLLAAERAAEARSLVETERRAVAREVHDVLGHSMVMIGLQANVALDALDDEVQVRRSLAEIRATARTGLTDIKQSLQVLAPRASVDREPVATLAGMRALDERGTPQAVPIAIGATAFRVVQESLTNVARHSAASEARVLVEHDPRRLLVTVTDPGPAPPAWTPGAGIAGLRERVAMVGARWR